MMKWIFSGMILLSVLFGILNGRMDAVSAAALESCGNAVQLTLTMMGSMCLWSGMMKIADEAGVTTWLSGVLSPVIRLLFPGMNPRGPAARAISMNLSANLLGLGNAATPLGISAMKEMARDTPKGYASDHMVLFAVLNTASMQLLPTTVALLRQEAGSLHPLDILPAVWIASFVSVLSGVVAAKLFARFGRRSVVRRQ